MAAEFRKVHRILALQQQLHRIEQWRLADLQIREEELAAEQTDLIAALNEDNALQGLFIDSMARRLQSLSDEEAKTGQAKEVQAVHLLDQASRLVCAERLAEAADLEEMRSNEKKELAEAIERLGEVAHKPPARLPRDS